MTRKNTMRIIGFAGWSGAGKTTLLSKLIPVLTARGLKVSTVKHAHHRFDIDRPGKDSFVHRMAGASEVFVSSAQRWAHMGELRGAPELGLADILRKLSKVDIVLIEGFKREPHPKIEIYRAENGKPFLYPEDDWIVAIAADTPIAEPRLPVIPLDDVEKIADAVLAEAMPAEEFGKAPV